MNIVLDLETLGVTPSSSIIQIGWAIFNENSVVLSDGIDVYVEGESLVASIETLNFHLIHMRNRRDGKFFPNKYSGVDIVEALSKFMSAYRNMREANKDASDNLGEEIDTIWCRGMDFDLPILKHHINANKLFFNFDYRKGRDIRTLESLVPKDKLELVYEDIENKNPHDAVSDAIYGAECIIRLKKYLKKS